MAEKMTRVRIDPELLATCATRNAWFALEHCLHAPCWPHLEVVQRACDEQDRHLRLILATAFTVPTKREASSDPTPDVEMSSDSVVCLKDSVVLDNSDHQEPADPVANARVVQAEESSDAEGTIVPEDESSDAEGTIVPENEESLPEEEVDELLASEPGSPHKGEKNKPKREEGANGTRDSDTLQAGASWADRMDLDMEAMETETSLPNHTSTPSRPPPGIKNPPPTHRDYGAPLIC